MRTLIGLGIAILFSLSARANAQVCTEGAAPSAQAIEPACGCRQLPAAANPLVEPPPPEPLTPVERAVQRDLISTIALGAILFGAGEAIAIAHYAATDASNRAFDFVPVIGPAVVGFHDRTPDWTSPLVFASWLQAAGVIIAASAGYVLADTRLHVGASVSPGNASIELGTRF
ncbi:MAG TPA: hypothetical protein VII38_15580 [Polyangia bacterium]|jgi:hypothetical protein